MSESSRATVLDQLHGYGPILDRAARDAEATGQLAPAEPARLRVGGRRHHWMLAAAVGLVVVAGAFVVTALMASPPRKDAARSGSLAIPRMRIAKIYAQASAMNGEQHPDHVRAATASTKGLCPPAINCSHPRVYVVEGHGRFTCQTCGGARPVRGRYLRVIINTRTFRVSSYGALTSANDLMTDHNAVGIPPTKRAAPIMRTDGTIQFTTIGQPSLSTSGGATLRVTDRYGVVVGEQYVPPNGLYRLRLPRADAILFWFEAVGARPACRIPLPDPGSLQSLQFDVPCKGDAPRP